MTLLPEATLNMYGRGIGEREQLVDLANQLGVADRVRFGSLDQHELGAAYRASDCVIFPSEWPEPFGMVPLEAMQCGVPVIASGVGGSQEFLSDEHNCLLFAPGDQQSLASAVRRLAADEELRQQIRRGGSATARAYDVGLLAGQYEEQFTSAVGDTVLP
jgi:glycosyltransferase involved in cell wall biosynthesis